MANSRAFLLQGGSESTDPALGEKLPLPTPYSHLGFYSSVAPVLQHLGYANDTSDTYTIPRCTGQMESQASKRSPVKSQQERRRALCRLEPSIGTPLFEKSGEPPP
jgi:hypothetical protein